jgi:CAAX amino terminal protease family.
MDKKQHFRFSNTGNAFLLAYGVYYLISVAYSIVYAKFLQNSVVAYWLQYAINPIAFIGASLLYSRKKNVDFKAATGIDNEITGKQVGILALLSVFCIMGFLPISNMFLDVLSRLGFNYEMPLPDTSENVTNMLVGIVFLAIAPAFSEEILMRGVVLNAAIQKRNFSYAIVITAAMFSLMHGNAFQTVHQFLLGMVLAYVVIVSRSLWAGIILHFFNNFISLTVDYPLTWVMNKIGYYTISSFAHYLIRVAAMFLGCTVVILLLRKFGEISRQNEELEGVTVIDVYPDGRTAEVKKEFKLSFRQFLSLFEKAV